MTRPIIAVTCLSFEAQVAAGPGVSVLCGTAQRYVDKLEAAVQAGGSGIISIGIAGGLAPGLAPGDWVIASGVIADGVRIPTDSRWSQPLLSALPSAILCRHFRRRRPGGGPGRQARAAREPPAPSPSTWNPTSRRTIAARHGVPFAACRVIIDPAERTLAAGGAGRHALRRAARRVRSDRARCCSSRGRSSRCCAWSPTCAPRARRCPTAAAVSAQPELPARRLQLNPSV